MATGKLTKLSLTVLICASAILSVNWGKWGKSPATNPASSSTRVTESAISIEFSQILWTPMVPEMGTGSPMRSVLHEHPVTHGSQFVIQLPPKFHVPAHYHTVNETHTVIEGTFIVQVEGKRTALQPGGFNYTPANVVHEEWTMADKGALIFVTVDGPYDLHPASPDAPAARP